MAIQQQDGEAGKPSAPDQAAAAISAKGASRRRFAKAGVGATGVILTLTSQPGMACSVCTTPSGSLSGGLKSYHGPKPICMGKPPSHWCSTGYGSNPLKKYGADFTCRYTSNRDCDYPKVLACKTQNGQDTTSPRCRVAQYCAAALLNVQAGYSTFLTDKIIKTIWTEFDKNLCYKPTATTTWYVDDICNYLRRTMD